MIRDVTKPHGLATVLVASSCLGFVHCATPTPAPKPSAPSEAEHASAPAPTEGERWWRDDVFYEIFVRSFADSDGDGIGDFEGLTARLDALNDGDPETTEDLGINALWLMPIYASPSYHGYDVTDYQAVNPDYGTLEDFDRLIAAAHQRGIRVIIDFVINHSSREHPWFIDAKSNPGSPYRDYYSWSPTPKEGWLRPWDGGDVWYPTSSGYYYALFWEGMPDLNLANPKVEAEMVEAMKFWLARGVDGFRVDAARHLFETEDGDNTDVPESHAFIRRVRAAISAEYPDALLVAEAWTSIEDVAAYYGNGDQYQLAFGFDTAGAIKSSTNDGNRADLNQVLVRAHEAYADRNYEAPFIANHDMERAMRTLGGDWTKAKLAACLLMAMPGTPFLYYGEEIGMQGGPTPKDEDKRTPYRWTDEAPGHGFTAGEKLWHRAEERPSVARSAQVGDPSSLYETYRRLIRLRRSTPAIADGDARLIAVEGGGRGVVAWLRERKDQRVLFVANLHSSPSSPFGLAISGTPRSLWALGDTPELSSAGERLEATSLAPQSCAYWELE